MTFALGTAAVAENHVIQAKGVKFDPMFLYIQPGDTVSFERMPSHNVETLDPMVPEGQEKIMSELGDNITVTFDTVGIVSYKCTPHWGNRMGGFIVVGEPENPGEIIDSYMAVTEEQKEYLPARGLLKKLRVDMEKNGMIGAPES
ncbi:plastocyanin/azurin family copper-binding protein [Poseidonocella sedimentorum]|nr:plastocyanin/azurin family copper-binding protein [Poseidonocella sedimentorum]